MTAPFDLQAVRSQFPALARQIAGRPAVFFDGPAGSQVPRSVIDAMSGYLASSNANCGGAFATSRETDAMLAGARAAVADLLGAGDPDCVIFGASMTALTFALSRAMARTWRPGDEVVVTRLDHDANVSPWLRAAEDAGVTVHQVGFDRADTTLDLADLAARLSDRTRLVAVCAASNATGTITPVADICRMVHEAGAEVFVDAVHYAPHALVDVAAWDCDYAACSAYKFFGPHIGVLWGKRAHMAALPSYQVRPAGDGLPDRWDIGTLCHEAIAGTRAAIEYLADLGRTVAPGPPAEPGDRRSALRAAYRAIGAHEADLTRRMLAGLADIPGVRVWGITDPERLAQRAPTVSLTHASRSPLDIARALGERGIFVWHGNYYAISVTEHLGLEPDGMVRIGLLHYNTADEVDRLLAALTEVTA